MLGRRFTFPIIRLYLDGCDGCTGSLYFFLAFGVIVDCVSEVEEVLFEQSVERVLIGSIISIANLQLVPIVDASALKSRVGLFFWYYFCRYFEQPAIHDIEGLFGQSYYESTFTQRRYYCDYCLWKKSWSGGIDACAIICGPHSESIVVVKSDYFRCLFDLFDVPD